MVRWEKIKQEVLKLFLGTMWQLNFFCLEHKKGAIQRGRPKNKKAQFLRKEIIALRLLRDRCLKEGILAKG